MIDSLFGYFKAKNAKLKTIIQNFKFFSMILVIIKDLARIQPVVESVK
jgi:hypothetical protein